MIPCTIGDLWRACWFEMEGEPQAWLNIVHVSIAFLNYPLVFNSFVIGDRA